MWGFSVVFVCLLLLFVGERERETMEILVEIEVALERLISQCTITALMNTQNYFM